MNLVLATVYSNYGGSTRVLLASREALAVEHMVVLRAPLAEADSRSMVSMPPQTLDSLWRKLATVPRVCAMLVREWQFIRSVGADVIYVHDEPSLYVYGLIARILGQKVVWHIHMEEGRGVKGWVRNLLCDAKIHVSECVWRNSGGKSALIRNPVTVRVRRKGKTTGVEHIYIVGSICRRKNQLVAVDALDVLRRRGMPLQLHLCGDVLERDYYDKIKRRVSDLLLGDRIWFDGYVEASTIYSRADLILCVSLYENQPLVLLEALAAGVRVIASDIPAHREIAALVGLGESALAPLTPVGLADAIVNADKLDVHVCAQKVQEIFGRERFEIELRNVFRSFANCWALRSA